VPAPEVVEIDLIPTAAERQFVFEHSLRKKLCVCSLERTAIGDRRTGCLRQKGLRVFVGNDLDRGRKLGIAPSYQTSCRTYTAWLTAFLSAETFASRTGIHPASESPTF
jgi:hypothetical protein